MGITRVIIWVIRVITLLIKSPDPPSGGYIEVYREILYRDQGLGSQN